MTCLRFFMASVLLGLSALAHAQQPQGDAPALPAGRPAALPQITLPERIELPVPRPVRAAQAALGMGRQRLALVVGLGSVAQRRVVDNAARDAQAVATALRQGGFVVIQREDLSARELQQELKDFQNRLQPQGVGLIYLAGLGAQVSGTNVLVTRDAALSGDGPLAARLSAGSVTLTDVANALVGPTDSPRLLVVDAAYRHPALQALPAAGLAEQRLPTGVMALFSQALGSMRDVPAVAPLPIPEPTDPREIAASPFAGALVRALAAPRVNGPDALRATRKKLVDDSLGTVTPWIGGDTDEKEELAEATLIDGLVPRTPEEIAREAARQGVRVLTREPAGPAGERPVADVLQQQTQPTLQPATSDSPPSGEDNSAGNRAGRPETPGGGSGTSQALSSVARTVGTLAGAAGTVASVGAGMAATQAAAGTAAVAGTAAGTATSAVGSVASTAARAAGSAATAATGSAAPRAAAQAATAPANAATAGAAGAPAAAPLTSGAMPPVRPSLPASLPTPLPTQTPLLTAPPSTLSAAGDLPVPPLPVEPPAASRLAAAAPAAVTRTPAAAPVLPTVRSNPFGYAEGDVFVYRVLDEWKGEVTGQTRTAIDEVLDNGEMAANGHRVQLDAQGRLVKRTNGDGSISEFEPAQELWWSNPRRGEGRSVRFVETVKRGDKVYAQIEWKGSTSVGRARRVQLPAGTFEVLPIETSGWSYESVPGQPLRSSKFWRTVWYAPELGHPVAIDIEDADHLGRRLKLERLELTHAQTSRSLPPR